MMVITLDVYFYEITNKKKRNVLQTIVGVEQILQHVIFMITHQLN